MEKLEAWAGELLDEVLARWLAGADNPSGLFHHRFDRAWRRLDGGPYTLVSQGRLIYNFCRGYERHGETYADTARRGLEALQRSFHPERDQPWCWAVQADGSLADATPNCYGHAFVILAAATAAEVLGEPAFTRLALDTWQLVRRHFADGRGGYAWYLDETLRPRAGERSQNPLMHLFEALLALSRTDSSGTARAGAIELWDFLAARRLGPGQLPEWYDGAWRPLEDNRRAIDVGHAFEWAFLLSEAVALGLGDHLIEDGRQFLDFGLAVGYDAGEGGVINLVNFAGRPLDGRKGWWQQCEAIRAFCRYARRHGQATAAEALDRCVEQARRTFHDPEYGGWYTDPPRDLDKGNAWKLDYHVVNFCLELLRG